ncbi:SDR family NAD(P)-dependent oxidoreductase [Pseudoroseomonas globiformis]|uniref:SDR family NAD(P)-dependent oxidoreductase n=1 Tax=Teichococcus globiformis TaxID=2307229 RepID=A0ABV7G2T5_9PROT
MEYGLRGQGAVVTGGDSGIGLETARKLLGEGARVVLSDKSDEALRQVAAQLSPLGDIVTFSADLTQPGEVEALCRSALDHLGQVHIVAHCAGITGAQGLFHEQSDKDWMEALDTNLMSAVRVLRGFIPSMLAQRHGRIVLVSSEDGVQPYPDELPYCASKAALLNLTKGLAKAYSGQGILVNAVSPAFIETPMTDAMMEKRAGQDGTSFDEAVQSFLKQERPDLVLGRRGRAEEVAAAILFLCSAGASFCTGTNIRVDGGSVSTMAI